MKDDSDGRNDMPFRFSSPKWIGLQTVDQLSSFLELPAKWAFLAQKVSRNFAPSWPDFQRRTEMGFLRTYVYEFLEWSGLRPTDDVQAELPHLQLDRSITITITERKA